MPSRSKRLKIKVEIVLEEHRWLAYRSIRAFKAQAQSIFQQTFLIAAVDFYRCEICITLTNDECIQLLNHRYRGIDKATNVLSFPQNHATNLRLNEDLPLLLGDIVISIDRVIQEAQIEDKIFEHHLNHLLVHSALHLIGYDHLTEYEAQTMETLEINVLRHFKIDNPYRNDLQ